MRKAMQFGERLNIILDLQGLSQRDLSDMTGIDAGQISNFIGGHREPSLGNFTKIVRALRVPSDMLLPADN